MGIFGEPFGLVLRELDRIVCEPAQRTIRFGEHEANTEREHDQEPDRHDDQDLAGQVALAHGIERAAEAARLHGLREHRVVRALEPRLTGEPADHRGVLVGSGVHRNLVVRFAVAADIRPRELGQRVEHRLVIDRERPRGRDIVIAEIERDLRIDRGQPVREIRRKLVRDLLAEDDRTDVVDRRVRPNHGCG